MGQLENNEAVGNGKPWKAITVRKQARTTAPDEQLRKLLGAKSTTRLLLTTKVTQPGAHAARQPDGHSSAAYRLPSGKDAPIWFPT